MKFHNTVSDNLWKLIVFKICYRFLVLMPIIVLFYQSFGLTMSQILFLQSVFALSIVILEIPTGYFADVWGRKSALVIGSIFASVGWLLYCIASDFGGFLFAEIVLGIGMGFISGSDSALVYDTLLQMGKEKDYKKYEGRMTAAEYFSEGFAAVIGGFLAVTSLRLPLLLEAVVVLLTVPIALTFVEPTRHKPNAVRKMHEIVKFCLHDHREVKWLIIYSATISASVLSLVWFIQPYFSLVGVDVAWFGMLWAFFHACLGLFSLSAHTIEEKLGKARSLILLTLLSVSVFFLLSFFQTVWAVPIILLSYFVRGMNGPLLRDYVNLLIPSEMRATVLSVKSMLSRLLFSIVGPFIGWVNDWWSLSIALASAGVIFLVFGTITLLFVFKNDGVGSKGERLL